MSWGRWKVARAEARFLRRPLYFLGLSGVYDLCVREPFNAHVLPHMYNTYIVRDTCMVYMHTYT